MKRGDIISVRPDGFTWGCLQHLGTDFIIVRLAGVVDEKYIEPVRVLTGTSDEGEEFYETLHERNYYVVSDVLDRIIPGISVMNWVIPNIAQSDVAVKHG